MEKSTLKSLIKVLGNLKLTTIITVATACISIFGIVFMLGVAVSKKEAGIDLKRPFDMKIKIEGVGEKTLTNLTVFSNPFVAEKDGPKNTRDLVIFQDKGDFDNEKIGIIRVKIQEVNIFKYTWKSIITSITDFSTENVYAQENKNKLRFIFGKYDRVKDYHQVLVNAKTIHRVFDDGTIIEYQIDEKGKAVPGSFRWIKKP